MSKEIRKIVVAIAGSSGAVYAKTLLDKLATLDDLEIGVVLSDNGHINWKLENGFDFKATDYPFTFYKKDDFNAPFASGSAQYDTMIVCPCSMGVVGRIASGVSNDLMTRAADVVLKERRRLILVPRETPFSLIHLRNMTTLTEAGAIICPAIPSFYNGANDLLSITSTVVDRVLDLAKIPIETYRWGESR